MYTGIGRATISLVWILTCVGVVSKREGKQTSYRVLDIEAMIYYAFGVAFLFMSSVQSNMFLHDPLSNRGYAVNLYRLVSEKYLIH